MTSIADLKLDHKNARKRTDNSTRLIKESLERYGAARSIVIDEDNRILAGNGTIEGAKAAGIKNLRIIETDGTEVIAVRRSGLTEDEKVGLAIADNRTSDLSEWDNDMLRQLSEDHDLTPWFENDELLDELLDTSDDDPTENPDSAPPAKLADKFGIAPFSVLNAREGWWQDRKRQWLSFGIQSEVGRKGNLLGMSDTMLEPDKKTRELKQLMQDAGTLVGFIHLLPGYYDKKKAGLSDDQIVEEYLASGSKQAGTSIFDPVLAELAYRWFSPENGIILDPFAGGSVRGIVAAKTNRQYIGHELREEQVQANREQAAEICADDESPPAWIHGDSRNIDRTCKDVKADLIFSCPPYADLEVYSDDPNDLSTMAYTDFIASYRDIIAKTSALLKPDRFACFVVGDVRDKKGNYYNFVGDTIKAFTDAGLHYYNEAILVTPVGTLPLRAGRAFSTTRKLGKTHQNVLVFVKGSGKAAATACGECSFGELDAAEEFGDVME